MTEGASGSLLFESEDEAGCSTKQSGDDEGERSKWLEEENNDTKFISCPGRWESNLEKKIGHVLRLSVLKTKNGIHPSRVLEKNINMRVRTNYFRTRQK